MKKILLASLVSFASIGFVACSNGDYDANPNTNNGNVTNPLNTNGGGNSGGGNNSSFDWSGTDPMSAKVGGNAWQATSKLAIVSGDLFLFQGYADDNTSIGFYVNNNATEGTVYDFTASSVEQGMYVTDKTIMDPSLMYMASVGNGGQIKILENDASHMKGLFYFNGKTKAGEEITVTEGYFNVQKN